MILIVEDDKDINNLIKELLSERGFETHQVFDGAEAVDYLKNNEVDLMLLDLMMPKLMGEDVINY
ncbi:MAG: response regulator transcription factor, partial [Fenollaria timonensis]